MDTCHSIVFVVDDDVSVRESLQALLRCTGVEVETFSSAQGFLDRPRADRANCLVLDVSLPDLNGLELQHQLAGERVDTPIVFITGYGDVPMSVRAMKAGAFEFLTKPFNAEELVAAVHAALDRSRQSRMRDSALTMLRESYQTLTRRECEVMNLVVTGLLNKQVGGRLGISEITVKAHRGSVMRKMKVRSLAELVNTAAKLGIGSCS